MRLLSRHPGLHSRQGAFLVDARAVMGALRKGRSSAPTLRHPLRVVSALCLACDWTWRYHYVPSESNAADWPSRGTVYRREQGRMKRRLELERNGRVRKFTKFDQYLVHQARMWRSIEELGIRGSQSGS